MSLGARDARLEQQDVLATLDSVLANGYGELTVIVHAGKIAEIVQTTRHRQSARGALKLVERSES